MFVHLSGNESVVCVFNAGKNHSAANYYNLSRGWWFAPVNWAVWTCMQNYAYKSTHDNMYAIPREYSQIYGDVLGLHRHAIMHASIFHLYLNPPYLQAGALSSTVESSINHLAH